VSDSEQPARSETVTGVSTVTVHRSVRYSRFMAAGGILGVLAALILTFTFPESDGFARSQVFGFLLLVGIIFGVALASIVALIIDRVVGRRGTEVAVDRLAPDDLPAIDAPDAQDNATNS
jgi:hypothetical protein